MSAMKNLDLMVQETSVTPEDYEENKTLICMHMNGEILFEQLPQHLKDLLFQWETQEIELAYLEPSSWEEAEL